MANSVTLPTNCKNPPVTNAVLTASCSVAVTMLAGQQPQFLPAPSGQ
ncbi:MAG: hypothetical protein M3358_02605 [Actinomycetota bacterium]|nr:hypothetical protein [Actinomycetota bacterium]